MCFRTVETHLEACGRRRYVVQLVQSIFGNLVMNLHGVSQIRVRTLRRAAGAVIWCSLWVSSGRPSSWPWSTRLNANARNASPWAHGSEMSFRFQGAI